jgi:hypothetical protein
MIQAAAFTLNAGVRCLSLIETAGHADLCHGTKFLNRLSHI